jgi:hypothetical protein
MSARDELPSGLAPEVYRAFEEWERRGGETPMPQEVLRAMKSMEWKAEDTFQDLVLMMFFADLTVEEVRSQVLEDAEAEARAQGGGDGFVRGEMDEAGFRLDDALAEIAGPDYIPSTLFLDKLRAGGVDDAHIASRMAAIRAEIEDEDEDEEEFYYSPGYLQKVSDAWRPLSGKIYPEQLWKALDDNGLAPTEEKLRADHRGGPDPTVAELRDECVTDLVRELQRENARRERDSLDDDDDDDEGGD